jgi:hypothetical protein
MRKILISTRGEFGVKRKDYAMGIAVRRLADMVKPKQQESEQDEKAVVVYNKALQRTSR